MRNIAWIIRKNLLLTFADRRGLLFAFLMPVLLAVVTGVAFSRSRSRPVSKLEVRIVSEDEHETVRKLIDALRASDSLDVDEGGTLDEARVLVKKRDRLAAVHFPPGTGERIAAGLFSPRKARIGILIDPSRQVERGVLQGVLVREMMRVFSESMLDPQRAKATMNAGRAGVLMDPFLPPAEKQAWSAFLESGVRMFEDLEKAEKAGRESGRGVAIRPGMSEPFQLEIEEVTGLTGAGFDMYAQTFSGVGVMFLLFNVVMGASNMVLERRRGTLKRILTTSATKTQLLAGEGLFTFAFSLVQLAALFAVGKVLFGVPFHGSKAGLLLIACSTAAAVTGFGVLVSAFGRTEKQVQGFATLVILLMSAIGGSWFPLWLMPDFMQTLAGATINRWAVAGFEGATWRGLGFIDILWPNAAVLLGMAAAFFGIGALRFRRE